ncbi:MAG: MFS transporter, partial [Pseudonocardia sp.]
GAVGSVADNGLAYTAVAEMAGSSWSGRALGIQNTGQNLVSAAAPVALGAVIGVAGYAVGFAVAALAPLAAIATTPVRGERPPSW